MVFNRFHCIISIVKTCYWLSQCPVVYGVVTFFQGELLSHERVLLQTIRFDLQVHHPYDYLLKFAESLKGIINFLLVLVEYVIHSLFLGEKSKIEHVLQMAWTFINDR